MNSKFTYWFLKTERFERAIVQLWSAVDKKASDYICMWIFKFGRHAAIPGEEMWKWSYLSQEIVYTTLTATWLDDLCDILVKTLICFLTMS